MVGRDRGIFFDLLNMNVFQYIKGQLALQIAHSLLSGKADALVQQILPSNSSERDFSLSDPYQGDKHTFTYKLWELSQPDLVERAQTSDLNRAGFKSWQLFIQWFLGQFTVPKPQFPICV